MIPVTHLRQNATFMYKNAPHRVLEYSHTHMGRGGGTIKVKIKNLKQGTITSETFKSGDKVDDIDITKREVQFLYRDGDSFTFMDPRSFEQSSVSAKILGDQANYLSEGSDVWLIVWDHEGGEEVLDVELPAKMVFKVAEAAPGDKGNTASNSYKEGKLENGVKVKIPLFVNAGDSIRISTIDGSYIERA